MRRIVLQRGLSATQLGTAAQALATGAASEVVFEGESTSPEFTGRRKKDFERGLSYLHDFAQRRALKNQVFLGGSCNPTTWRKTLAIPLLEAAGVPYFDPQRDDWTPEMMELEASAKIGSSILLFVFDRETRAIATLTEAYEFIGARQQSVVIFCDFVQTGLLIEGQTITAEEAHDINFARRMLLDYAGDRGCHILPNLEDAVAMTIRISHLSRQEVRIDSRIISPSF